MTSQKESRVGILIPSHNHSRYLKSRIDSILGQSFQDFSVYIVDDGSSDTSWDLLQYYLGNPQVKMFRNFKPSGSPFSQYSRFIGGSFHHQYWWIAESDDSADRNFLKRTISVLDDDSEINFAFTAARLINEEGKNIGSTSDYLFNYFPELDWSQNQLIESQLGLQMLIRGQFVPNLSGMLFRTNSIHPRELLDIHRFKLAGDWKFVISLQNLGKSFYISDELNLFRTHSENARTKAKTSTMVSEYLYCNYYAWKKLKKSISLDIAIRSTFLMAKYEGTSPRKFMHGLFRLSPFLATCLTVDVVRNIFFKPSQSARKVFNYLRK